MTDEITSIIQTYDGSFTPVYDSFENRVLSVYHFIHQGGKVPDDVRKLILPSPPNFFVVGPPPPGLYLFPEYITHKEEKELLVFLNNQDVGSVRGGRCVKQWGWEYSYSKRNIGEQLDPFPDIIDKLAKRCENTLGDEKLTQCIANRYLHGEGISPHIDHLRFGKCIYSLSLGNKAQVTFTKGREKTIVTVPPRSLYVMSEDSRYKYKHSLKNKGGVRWSITFRHFSS